MALFMSTHTNRVDRKGRVSVPAQFRQAVAQSGFPGLVLFPSSKWPCIDGCDMTRMEQLSQSLDAMDVLSEERNDVATSLFADAHPIQFDGDGRIVLPRELCAPAGIDEQAAFVGLGPTFQIWNPDWLAEQKRAARERAKGLSGVALRGGGGGA